MEILVKYGNFGQIWKFEIFRKKWIQMKNLFRCKNTCVNELEDFFTAAHFFRRQCWTFFVKIRKKFRKKNAC